jgi:hypothetical protein
VVQIYYSADHPGLGVGPSAVLTNEVTDYDKPLCNCTDRLGGVGGQSACGKIDLGRHHVFLVVYTMDCPRFELIQYLTPSGGSSGLGGWTVHLC